MDVLATEPKLAIRGGSLPPIHLQCSSPLESGSAIWTDQGQRAETLREAQKHLKQCSMVGCPRCCWHKISKPNNKWLQVGWRLMKPGFPGSEAAAVETIASSSVCWCVPAFTGSVWGLGCLPCSKYAGLGTFTNFSACRKLFKPTLLKRHAASKGHLAKCSSMLGVKLGSNGHPIVAALSGDSLALLLDHLLKGRSLASFVNGTSSKTYAMQWCLHEAIKELDRTFLEKAVTIVLCRDERAGQLAVRFRAATSDMQTRSGLIGIVEHCGGKATQITQATRIAIRRLCTTFEGSPSARLKETRCSGLEKLVQGKIEVVVNDAAANEMLAGDVGRGRRVAQAADCNPAAQADPRLMDDIDRPLTPNLILVARDWAHSFRRPVPGFQNSL
jgi:hypothetical protein